MLSTSCAVNAGPHGSFAASGGNNSELRERIKNTADVAFHRINEKHFGKLIDEVRQFEKSLSVYRRNAPSSIQLADRSKQHPFRSVQLVRLDVSCNQESDLHR